MGRSAASAFVIPRAVAAAVRRARLWAIFGAVLTLPPAALGLEWLVAGRLGLAAALACLGVEVLLGGLAVSRLGILVAGLEREREEAVRSERRLRMIFDSAPIGISLGRDGVMSETNPALQRMLGYTGAELRRMHYREVVHPDDCDLEPQLELDRGLRESIAVDQRYVARDGEVVPARVRVARGRDGFGIALVEDVREQRALEERAREAQKLEAVAQLAGGVAHDFNNLMTAVGGYAELLLGDVSEARARRRVNAIRHAAARASDLTRELLAFSRQQVLDVREVDLGDVVSAARRVLEPLLGPGIRLELAPAGGQVLVRVDPEQIVRVLACLAENARDAMGGEGALRVGLGAGGGEAVLTVADTGPGIPEEVREQIFEPFFTTRSLAEASGLGLAIVHGIVLQSGGSIEVDSHSAGGTRFTIRLPLAQVARVGAAGYD